jgi:hypothetical protein
VAVASEEEPVILNVPCEACALVVRWDTDLTPDYSVLYVGDDVTRFEGAVIVCSEACGKRYIERNGLNPDDFVCVGKRSR